MRTGLTQKIRAILRGHPDGLPISALMDMTGQLDRGNITKCLQRMPDVYIDRWDGPNRGQYAAIWCIVTPPDNCPHPTREVVAVQPRTRRDSREDEREADENSQAFDKNFTYPFTRQ